MDAQALSEEADEPRRLTILSAQGSTTRPIPQTGRLTVGRHPDNGLCLDDPEVSRFHAVLHFEDGRFSAEDLGGANGTKVAGRRIEAGLGHPVGPGEPVQIGGAVLLLQRGAAEPSEPVQGRLVPSPKMQALYEEAAQVARGRLAILLLGETGVGKEVFAQAIHAASPRSDGPWVVLNCGALAESLLESELFGHNRGAFTGADADKPGLLEAAHGGTLLLDEVGDLPAAMQVKLLRAIENQEVLRLGAVRAQPIDVRFVAATNRDLEAAVQQGSFRRDLFFRLAGATFELPPLRLRSEEIEPFVRRFAQMAGAEAHMPAPEFSPEAMQRLVAHTWPGNLRELKNVVTRAALLCGAGPVQPQHLPSFANAVAPPVLTPAPAASPPKGLSAKQEDERARVIEALEAHAGNQTRAARSLGISRQALVKKLDRYGLPRPRK